jgi:hypothetical protein
MLYVTVLFMFNDLRSEVIIPFVDIGGIVVLQCLNFLFHNCNKIGAIVVVIVWKLDLQLSMQSVPITIKVVSSNPVHSKVYLIQHYVITFVSDLLQVSSFLHQ